MDKQVLERTPDLLEQIVCYDWMSPTLVECEAFGISDNLHARISFHKEKGAVWIIDRNKLTIRSWPELDHAEVFELVR